MKQWIIDRYNKGQNDYGKQIKDVHDKYVYFNHGNTLLYDFLFNPKWEFAKAFSIYIFETKQYNKLDLEINSDHDDVAIIVISKLLLKEMAIADDVLKYLDCFENEKSGI